MNNPSRIGSISPSGEPLPALLRRFIAESGRHLAGLLPRLWDTLFDKLDEALYDLADKSVNNLTYIVYFDAQKIIRKHHHRLRIQFLRRIQERAERVASGLPETDPLPHSEPSFHELDLVGDSELEEILAIDNLVSKAESRYRQELLMLDRQLAGLLGRTQQDPRLNPYSPFALCDAFRAALLTVPELEPSIKLVIYKLFDKYVMDQLGDFYRHCLSAPEFKRPEHETHTTLSGGREVSATVLTPAARTQTPALATLPETMSLPFEMLQGLLKRQRQNETIAEREVPPSSPENRIRIPTAELMVLLSNLQAEGDPDPITAHQALRQRLSAALAASDPAHPERAIAETDADTLDLVFLFFEHLLQANDLPDAIKVLIGRMQIPVAKLALLHKDFFSDQGHPARILLNHIGQAAVGWTEDDGRGPDTLYGMIERVCERIVLDFDGDPALFTRMDRYFVAFIALEQSRASAAETAAIAARQHGTTDTESQQIDAAIDERLRHYTGIPRLVDVILRQGWVHFLRHLYRTQGVENPAWRSALEVVDRLLWSVQPKLDAEGRRQLLNQIPSLVRDLREGLTEVDYDQRQIMSWLKELQTLHLGVLQGVMLGPPPAPIPPPGDTEPRPPGTGLGFGIGDWVEVTGGDGRTTRLKLAWYRQENDELFFVDRHGRPGPELTRADLESLLGQGLARVLGNGLEPLADRALRSMLNSLSNERHRID